MLSAGQRLEELEAEQRGHGVRQHALDDAGRRGDAEDEHQRQAIKISTVTDNKQSLVLPLHCKNTTSQSIFGLVSTTHILLHLK